MTYLHSGDKDTTKLTRLLCDNTDFMSTNINTKGDKYEFNSVKFYIDFFQTYYHKLRNYEKFELKDLNIKPNGKNKYDIKVTGKMIMFDNLFNYWKLMEIDDLYTITIGYKNNESIYLIKSINSNTNAKFIRFEFDVK